MVFVINNSAVILTSSLANVPVEINGNFLYLLTIVMCKFEKLRGHNDFDLSSLQE